MPLSACARKKDTKLVGVINPAFQGIFGVLLHSSVGKSMYKIQSILWEGFSISLLNNVS